jgi:hypothetical protein
MQERSNTSPLGIGPIIGAVLAVIFYKFIKMLEYEVCFITEIVSNYLTNALLTLSRWRTPVLTGM